MQPYFETGHSYDHDQWIGQCQELEMTLQTPDLCSQLDRMKKLCDRLEAAQHDQHKYHELIRVIDVEIDAFKAVVCGYHPDDFSKRPA